MVTGRARFYSVKFTGFSNAVKFTAIGKPEKPGQTNINPHGKKETACRYLITTPLEIPRVKYFYIILSLSAYGSLPNHLPEKRT